MSASEIAYAKAYGSSVSATYTDTDTSLNVAVGDLLVAFYTAASPTNLVIAQDDGSDVFSDPVQILSVNVPNPVYMAYKIITSADAAFVVRASHDNSLNWYRILNVEQFRPDSGETIAFDAASVAGTGTGTAVVSGNIDTTGTDEILVGVLCCVTTATASAHTIGGVDTDEWQYANKRQQIGYRFSAATESAINLSCTLSGSDTWGAYLIAFKSAAGGGETAYAYVGSGQLLFNGAGNTQETNVYPYVGSGRLTFGGAGNTSYTTIGNYSYTGSGQLLFNGTGAYSETNTYSYSGSGQLVFGGAANASHTEVGAFSYAGSGTLYFGGAGTYLETNIYEYLGSGQLLIQGAGVTSYTTDTIFIYTGSGQILFNGASEYTETNDYAMQSSGGIVFGSGSVFEIGTKQYSFDGSGQLLFSGGAVTSYFTPDSHIYVGSGYIQFGGTAEQPLKGTGLWEIVFDSYQPGITFDSH